MKYILRAKTRSLKGKITLPRSKSISNRVLIIQALAKRPFDIHQLSDADDTTILTKALKRNDIITDVGPAGTAMRFLTAFYASQPGEKVLTGSDRMKKRPIAILVDALNALGAKITYLENEGFPPLHIEGRRLSGGTVAVKGSVSSQFITALMLIGPTLPQKLTIQIEGDPLSRPYIIMTQRLMQQCGAQVEVDSNEVVVMPGRYRSNTFTIERDWSAAAFWMGFAALSKRSNILLEDLNAESLQGDSSSVELFQMLGIDSVFEENGLHIQKGDRSEFGSHWNFRNHPDLVQPAAFTAAGLGIGFVFEGLDNLRLKETDRISALETELRKFGINATVNGHVLSIEPTAIQAPTEVLSSYDDHRMVMSLASMSMLFPELIIDNPMAVAKSYPGFWKEVEKFVDVRPTR